LRMPDGRRLQRRLGPVWAKRSRPPAGYLTRAQADARLEAMLNGQDEAVPVEIPADSASASGGSGASTWTTSKTTASGGARRCRTTDVSWSAC
jgi:hypothetical protein